MLWSILKLVFVSLPVLIFSLIIGFLAWNFRRDRWYRVFRNQAARYSAQVDTYRFRPRMNFSVHGQTVSVFSQGIWFGNRQPSTVLQWSLNHPNGSRLSVLPKNLGERYSIQRGWGQVATGDAKLDQLIVVCAEDLDHARHLLRFGLTTVLSELVYRFRDERVLIEKDAKKIRVCCSGRLVSDIELADFIRLALNVCELLIQSEVGGIEFSEMNTAVVSSEAKCPVCSERPQNATVICYSCKTPHCRECWDYNGKCGMFACGDTRSLKTPAH